MTTNNAERQKCSHGTGIEWCKDCPLDGRPRACTQTEDFIKGCKEFSEKMKG